MRRNVADAVTLALACGLLRVASQPHRCRKWECMRGASVVALVFAITGCQRMDQEQVAWSMQGLTSQETAAHHLTAVLGVPVLASDVKTYPASREFIPGYSPALQNMLLTNHGTLLFAKHHNSGLPFVSIAVRASLSPQFMNASVVVAELADSQDQECTINICDTTGRCSGLTGMFDADECNKPQLCHSDADCESLSTATCYVRQCGMGACVLQEITTNSGLPCPPSGCDTDAQCGSNKKTCHYKKCMAGLCTADEVEVDQTEPCPRDECQDDDECGGLTGPPIFDDVHGGV